jgi:hypothetical protein
MPPIKSTQNVSTAGAVIAGDGSAAVTLLAANPARIGFSIQNNGTTAAKIAFGTATTNNFHYVLKGGTGDNDGTGGSISFFSGAVYTGIITVFGATTAKLSVLEIAP